MTCNGPEWHPTIVTSHHRAHIRLDGGLGRSRDFETPRGRVFRYVRLAAACVFVLVVFAVGVFGFLRLAAAAAVDSHERPAAIAEARLYVERLDLQVQKVVCDGNRWPLDCMVRTGADNGDDFALLQLECFEDHCRPPSVLGDGSNLATSALIGYAIGSAGGRR